METLRRRIMSYLREGERSLRDISQELRISEKDALGHLEFLARGRGADRLVLDPARCGTCGFVFEKRKRPGKPGRCPVCKGSHISGPRYSISGPS